jgi:hypothetical protein
VFCLARLLDDRSGDQAASAESIGDKRKHLRFYIGCSFKFILKVAIEESIVNAPQFTDHGLAV